MINVFVGNLFKLNHKNGRTDPDPKQHRSWIRIVNLFKRFTDTFPETVRYVLGLNFEFLPFVEDT
jgi:hypothetical protein